MNIRRPRFFGSLLPLYHLYRSRRALHCGVTGAIDLDCGDIGYTISRKQLKLEVKLTAFQKHCRENFDRFVNCRVASRRYEVVRFFGCGFPARSGY